MSGLDHQLRPRAIHLFAGAGGGLLGGRLLGWRTVCAVELNRYCRDVLVSRQNDGSLDPFPIWDDVRTFDGRPWCGCCDILCGGPPCQNISPLGDRSGINGSKSCLWREFARLIGEIRPKWVFVENSSDLCKLGLDVVLRDLASRGYDAEWTCMSAAELGAPHVRDRLWLLAKDAGPSVRGGAGEIAGNHPQAAVRRASEAPGEVVHILADADEERRAEHGYSRAACQEIHTPELPGEDQSRRLVQCGWWQNEPGVRRVADGVANGVDRLEALGNGQVSYVAARVFDELRARFGD